MNTKDFERIALAVRAAQRITKGREYLRAHNRGVEWVARNLADEFAFTHPEFDRARFLAACGVQS